MLPDLTRRSLDVAADLLGCLVQAGPVTVRLVEVEAYEGADDPASHAFRGPTRRNAAMFGPAGHLYVYRLHGSYCANVVCGPTGVATAVLLRAAEVIEGRDLARARRAERRSTAVPDRDLARGPGNLCCVLAITEADNGTSLLGGGTVSLRAGTPVSAPAAGPRSTVAKAAGRPWRFWDAGSASVSPLRRHPRASG